MMPDTRKEAIEAYIKEHGPQGVNALSKVLEIPLSTMQKYLDRQQTYFKKNAQRKWDLPENVASEVNAQSSALLLNGIENSIELLRSQLTEMLTSIDSSILPVQILKKNITNNTSVASKGISERIAKLIKVIEDLPKIIKSKRSNFSDELFELLMNTRWEDMMLDLGSNYMQEVIEPALYSVLLGETKTLSEDAMVTITEYQ